VLDDAGRAMVEKYTDVAEAAAWRFCGRATRAELDEVKAIAYLGLCQAAERFPAYQAEHGYALDDRRYLVAFLSRRVNGAILDWARSRDWVTRTQRKRLKLIDECAPDGASIAEQAQAAGLTEDEVRDALAAKAASPMYLDAFQGTGPDQGEPGWPDRLADPAADVESQAAARGILGAALRAARALPVEQQALLMYRYHRGLPPEDTAEALGVTPDRLRRLHEAAVLRVHDAMLAAASG
jgi:RNA polymerase sigma factor (sigma-70 family)